jgi:hypothetical protein
VDHRGLAVVDELPPERRDCAPDQPRDVHLRDTEPLRDLRLREIVDEAELQDASLTRAQRAQARRQRQPLRDNLVDVGGVVVAGRPRLSAQIGQGQRHARAARRQDVADVTLPQPHVDRNLGRARGTVEASRQLELAASHRGPELVEPARYPNRRRPIPKMVPDRADDRRDRERAELDLALVVEAIDCRNQGDRSDLNEIVELLAPVRKASCQGFYEREETFDQPVARSVIAGASCAGQLTGLSIGEPAIA